LRLDAVSDGRPVLVTDIGRGSEQRWPAFAESVLDAGVQAVFALPTAIAATLSGC
jgi:hypothetical protein